MERDFMGLSSKEEAIEAGFSKSSAFQWSLSSYEGFTSGEHQKNINSSGQLTIFYKGMVNVYDDMSPEKAQAIMLLARNGAEGAPRTQPGDVSQPGHTNPLSVGPSATPDAPNSLRRMMQSAVPQMRGASLARFLQKRKERVMASAPYKSSVDSNDKPGPSKDDKN